MITIEFSPDPFDTLVDPLRLRLRNPLRFMDQGHSHESSIATRKTSQRKKKENKV